MSVVLDCHAWASSDTSQVNTPSPLPPPGTYYEYVLLCVFFWEAFYIPSALRIEGPATSIQLNSSNLQPKAHQFKPIQHNSLVSTGRWSYEASCRCLPSTTARRYTRPSQHQTTHIPIVRRYHTSRQIHTSTHKLLKSPQSPHKSKQNLACLEYLARDGTLDSPVQVPALGW